eukprot:3515848-Rhodomonas_salina.1
MQRSCSTLGSVGAIPSPSSTALPAARLSPRAATANIVKSHKQYRQPPPPPPKCQSPCHKCHVRFHELHAEERRTFGGGFGLGGGGGRGCTTTVFLLAASPISVPDTCGSECAGF